MEMTIPQCKMARAALGWGIRDLATRARVGTTTVSRFEAGQGTPIPSTVAAMRRAFEAAGVVFTERGVELHDQLAPEEAILPQAPGKASTAQRDPGGTSER